MKRITLIFALLCLGTSLFANDKSHPGDFAQLQQLLSGKINRAHLLQLYGEASIININNQTSEELWQYTTSQHNITLRWDTKNDQLRDFTYSNHNRPLQKWQNNNVAAFQMGQTNLTDVLAILGEPTDMVVKPGEQRLKYVYAGTQVEVQLKNGVLGNYHVSATSK